VIVGLSRGDTLTTVRHQAGMSSDTQRSEGRTDLPSVSLIIASHTGRRDLRRCLPSVLGDDYPNLQVIVVDNASTDGTAELVEREYPSVKIIRNESNLGFGRANNAGARDATGKYLAFLNQDAVVRLGWLDRLVMALEAHPEAALATPKILLLDDPDTINACGDQSHYTGLSFCRGAGQPADSFAELESVNAVSGAAFVIRGDVFKELGGFDDDFFLYMEDIDLSWRARLSGYSCLYVPDSIVLHDYELTFGPDKSYYQERNRGLMLLKNLRWRTIGLLLPALLLSELITWSWIVLRDTRNVDNKARAYGWILRNWRAVAESRRQVQAQRRITDKELLGECQSTLAYEQLAEGRIVRAAQMVLDPLLTLLHRACLRVMWW
jgi:GT2 family glycosyltransferase